MDWISVNDRLPDPGNDRRRITVLVAVYDGSGANDSDYGSEVTDMVYDKKTGFMEFIHGEWNPVPAFDKVTHWMYFPESPKRNP